MVRVALACCFLLSACSREYGAVLVRWQLIDAVTGIVPNGCNTDSNDECCASVHSERLGTHNVLIDQMVLTVARVNDDDGDASTVEGVTTYTPVSCASCCFACSLYEHTTNFELVAGDYKLGLQPLRCGIPVGDVPPAEVRTVTAGEVTNLNSVEILIDADTYSPTYCDVDAGTAPDESCTIIDVASQPRADLATSPDQ